MMFILILASGYPTPKYGGNGIFEFDQAKALAQAGCKVVYAAVDLRSLRRWRKWGCEHFYKDGVEVYAVNIPLGRVPHSVLKRVGQIGLKHLYRRIIKDHGEPDVVHAHFFAMAEIALALKPLVSMAKFIMTEHSSFLAGEYSLYPQWIKQNAKSVYKAYDNVICVSHNLSGRLQAYFGINSVVVYNMLDSLFLNSWFAIRPINFEKIFSFVFIGSLIPRKSPIECIKAFYSAFNEKNFLMSDGRNITLELIGNGSLFSECERLIAELGISRNVVLHGFQTRDKIAEILRRSDCFVLPSKLETFGVVYIEAMACGLPVIATRCGGPESFVNEDNGVLIPVDEEGALISAFREMAANIGRYNKKEIASMASDNFSPEAIADKLVDVYTSLLKNCNNTGSNNGR